MFKSATTPASAKARENSNRIEFWPEPTEAQCQSYLFDLADESGLGEIFVATDQPLPKGSVVSLSKGNEEAKGIVAWSRSWFGKRGMLVKLFEVEEGSAWRRWRQRAAAKTSNS